MKQFFNIGYLVIMAAIGCVVGAFLYAQYSHALIEKGEAAVAKIVDFYYREETQGNVTYKVAYPVLEFQDRYGVKHRVDCNQTTNSYQLDDELNIVYSPDNPQDIIVDDFFGRWGPSLILIVMALVFFPLGVYEVKKQRKLREMKDWVPMN